MASPEKISCQIVYLSMVYITANFITLAVKSVSGPHPLPLITKKNSLNHGSNGVKILRLEIVIRNF